MKAHGADAYSDDLLITKNGLFDMCAGELVYYLGGFIDDGDSYDTQLANIDAELAGLRNQLRDRNEVICEELLSATRGHLSREYPEWDKVEIHRNKRVVAFVDGKKVMLSSANHKEST